MKKFLYGFKTATAILLAVIFCMIYPMQTLSDSGIFQLTQNSEIINSNPEDIPAMQELQETQAAEPYIIGEDISKRQASSKHFLMSDGSYQIAEYPINVHYLRPFSQMRVRSARISKLLKPQRQIKR